MVKMKPPTKWEYLYTCKKCGCASVYGLDDVHDVYPGRKCPDSFYHIYCPECGEDKVMCIEFGVGHDNTGLHAYLSKYFTYADHEMRRIAQARKDGTCSDADRALEKELSRHPIKTGAPSRRKSRCSIM
jgi:hypothetical protein